MSLTTYNLSEENKKRVNRILEVIISYARLDFTNKTEVIGNNDILDAIGAGVNMLGEELETSSISLREKEQLLKEVHHRVKNNLQVVSSLLSLQSQNVLDPHYLQLIEDSRRRIQSMALVHEMLYSARNLSNINLDSYITQLCNTIHKSYAMPATEIEFKLDIQKDIYFDLDKMIPIGLILNEVISNSFKYAFPEGKGIVSVKLAKYTTKFKLEVWDNGVGYEMTNADNNPQHLGVQLIHMLAEQIEGIVLVSHENGTRYELIF